MANDVEPAAGGADNFALILRQIGRVRRRINSLAAQQLIFSSFAILIGTAAAVVLAALFLRPELFLVVALGLLLLALIALPLVILLPSRHFSGFHAAAEIADRRAELRGRLTTLVGLEEGARYRLWSYLVEDTVARCDDFQPSRIVQRRVSRTLYAFLSACVIAALAAGMTYLVRLQHQEMQIAMNGPGLEISPSEIQPGGSSSGAQADIEGDPTQLRNLAQRLQQQEGARSRTGNPVSRLADRARDFASSLQNKLTGRNSGNEIKIKMRLAKALSEDQANPPPPGSSPSAADSRHGDQLADNGPAGGPAGGGASMPGAARSGASVPGGTKGPGNGPAAPQGGGGTQAGGAASDNSGLQPQSGGDDSGGVTSGSGTDATGLMGPPDALARHGKDSFELPVDAQAAPGSPIRDGQPYNPPHVKVELNSEQAPDQPVARAEVPAGDRETIRRVFER